MGDTEQDAINALRAAGLEAEAVAVQQLRARHKETMDAYHAGQRASYKAGQEAAREQCAKACEDEADRWRGEQDVTDFLLCAGLCRSGA